MKDTDKDKLAGDIERLNEEILQLREVIFKQSEEINALYSSRVVGRVIKVRDFIVGQAYPRIKKSPRSAIRYSKNAIGFFMPMSAKEAMGRKKRELKEKMLQPMLAERVVLDNTLYEGVCLVSVVIPYYNRSDTIDDTIRSLTSQTYQNFEIIIVNDGSTEEGADQRLKGIKKQLSVAGFKVAIMHQKNAGVAAARNNGIQASKGKYIVCLDSDDVLVSTYIEECVNLLEADPDSSLVTTYRTDFGVRNEEYHPLDYNPLTLIDDNMVTTAAMFKKTAWDSTLGYKSDIGYEDWEYWLTLAENGFWGRTIREPLFKYRVAMNSRFSEDKMVHWTNIKNIKKLHAGYKTRVRALIRQKKKVKHIVSKDTAFINLGNPKDYSVVDKPAILIAIPWMTFGGAETLIYNFCQGLKEQYDITFVTGLLSSHEWEYKFREISDKIYHLPELFLSRDDLYIDFLSNYISVHRVDVLHIIHSGYIFDMLPEIKNTHPTLSVAVTMFNDRVPEYVEKSVKYKEFIDSFNTDSEVASKSFSKLMQGMNVEVIPNGIDCQNTFNPDRHDRNAIRKELGLKDELAILFVGRLSEEKNPDVFIKSMDIVTRSTNAKAFIIGDGPMRRDCENTINDLKNNNLTYLGYKDDVAHYLAAADIFVLPSSIEGFPLSILEAMAMGVAVIASKVGAVPDIIEQGVNGYVINPGSINDIETSVANMRKKGRLNEIRENNINKVQRYYSQKQVAKRYSELYKGLLK